MCSSVLFNLRAQTNSLWIEEQGGKTLSGTLIHPGDKFAFTEFHLKSARACEQYTRLRSYQIQKKERQNASILIKLLRHQTEQPNKGNRILDNMTCFKSQVNMEITSRHKQSH